jgi:hypothetical protein
MIEFVHQQAKKKGTERTSLFNSFGGAEGLAAHGRPYFNIKVFVCV